MARTIQFSFMQGGGATFTNGRVTLSPTSVRTDGVWTVLPSETDPIYLVDGVGAITDVEPTPTDPDGWRYQVRVEATDRRVHEFLVEVPTGTTPINFNLLPQISAMTLPIDATGVQLKQWIESVRSHANAANENALEALAQIASYHGPNAGPPAFRTADTWEDRKMIVMSDGTVKVIPAGDYPPPQPDDPTAAPGSTLVRVTWEVTTAATTYKLFRNGAEVYSGSDTVYTDRNVTNGATYTYYVIAYDQHGQRSVSSASVVAGPNVSLNVSPTCQITTWPPTLPYIGKAYVRVCGSDIEAQTLAFALSVNIGTLTATDDPSIWIYSN